MNAVGSRIKRGLFPGSLSGVRVGANPKPLTPPRSKKVACLVIVDKLFTFQVLIMTHIVRPVNEGEGVTLVQSNIEEGPGSPAATPYSNIWAATSSCIIQTLVLGRGMQQLLNASIIYHTFPRLELSITHQWFCFVSVSARSPKWSGTSTTHNNAHNAKSQIIAIMWIPYFANMIIVICLNEAS